MTTLSTIKSSQKIFFSTKNLTTPGLRGEFPSGSSVVIGFGKVIHARSCLRPRQPAPDRRDAAPQRHGPADRPGRLSSAGREAPPVDHPIRESEGTEEPRFRRDSQTKK